MKLTTLLFFGILSILTSCNGQISNWDNHAVLLNEINVKGDTVKELGNSIMVIYQDKKNTYWFGSWETGLYKYDGKELVNFTTKHGLLSNRIDEIKEDKLGNIYIGSANATSSISIFNGYIFTTLTAVPSENWQLESTDIWFKSSYGNTGKVYRYDGTTLFELQLPKPPNLSNPFDIYSIYKDRRGNIWFGTNPVGVCRYDGKSFEWITEEDVTEFRNNEGANGVRSIVEDKNGDFWFNTENRYSVYDSITTLKSNKFYTRHESIGSLDGKNTSGLKEYLSIAKDNNNDLWLVTYRDGVWKYDGMKITHYAVQDNSKDITLLSIYKDSNGDLWLGTSENGAYKFNGKTFEKFIPK
jgi:ligand-binding sensor domain-containing protein